MNNNDSVGLTVNVIVKEHNNKPCVELRRLIMDKELIQEIVQCAYRGIPFIIFPHFSKPLHSINTLIEKKLLYRDEEGILRFTE